MQQYGKQPYQTGPPQAPYVAPPTVRRGRQWAQPTMGAAHGRAAHCCVQGAVVQGAVVQGAVVQGETEREY